MVKLTECKDTYEIFETIVYIIDILFELKGEKVWIKIHWNRKLLDYI